MRFWAGVVLASTVWAPALLFVLWMWKTDNRLLTRLLRQERETTWRLMKMGTITPTPTQGTTTSSTSEGRTITLRTDDEYEKMSTVDKIEYLHRKIVNLVSGYND